MPDGSGWRRSPWKRAQAAAIAAIGTPLVEALGATYSWRETGVQHLETVERQGRQPILALWHGRILSATLYFRDRGIVAMTSENFDGEWVAKLMSRFGYHAARGSTSRGGARALAQLRREMAEGYPTAFTVDGPRGPARVAQPGAAWLASATGHPIVPFHIEANRYWTVRSWDRHQVPKPGSELAVAIGAPIDVPERADEAAIERGRARVQQSLVDLEHQAVAMLARSVH
jgi:lysophospholipid acyltransferase (LPLAT)-like uncharacterized protein